MDVVVMLSPAHAGHAIVFDVVCRLSKMAHFVACMTGQTFAQRFLITVVRLHGMPGI